MLLSWASVLPKSSNCGIKGFFRPQCLFHTDQDPFSGNWCHFAQHPRGPEGFWRNQGQKMAHWPTSSIFLTQLHCWNTSNVNQLQQIVENLLDNHICNSQAVWLYGLIVTYAEVKYPKGSFSRIFYLNVTVTVYIHYVSLVLPHTYLMHCEFVCRCYISHTFYHI